MIDHSDLFHHAEDAIFGFSPQEVKVRRAISCLYYALFHRLAACGAAVFQEGGTVLQNRAARAYNHGPMRKVCEAYTRALKSPFDASLQGIAPHPPSRHIITICEAFVELQEARHLADYDIGASFSHDDAIRFWGLVRDALYALESVKNLPETRIFLTALLLADRWTRRG